MCRDKAQHIHIINIWKKRGEDYEIGRWWAVFMEDFVILSYVPEGEKNNRIWWKWLLSLKTENYKTISIRSHRWEHSTEKMVVYNTNTVVFICVQSWSCATVLYTQILLGESWSPRSAVTPVSTGNTTTSAQIPGPRRTSPEPSGHRNQGTAGDRILQVSFCTVELTLCHSSPYPNSSQKELVSQEYWYTGLQEGQATVRDRKTS